MEIEPYGEKGIRFKFNAKSREDRKMILGMQKEFPMPKEMLKEIKDEENKKMNGFLGWFFRGISMLTLNKKTRTKEQNNEKV